MFVLRKILNSGTNVPESCRMETTAGVSYQVGSALTLTSGKLTNATATDKPLYIAAESANANEKSTLLCYPIYDNMIFEVPVTNPTSALICGVKVTLGVVSGYAIKVTSTTTNGVATVVDRNGANRMGDTVYVKFEN